MKKVFDKINSEIKIKLSKNSKPQEKDKKLTIEEVIKVYEELMSN